MEKMAQSKNNRIDKVSSVDFDVETIKDVPLLPTGCISKSYR